MADRNLYLSSFMGGAAAGIVVDMTLFPLDTLKTRLQSNKGFFKSGGFKGIYRGIAAQALGSAPQAALFFCTYETIKAVTIPKVPAYSQPCVHVFASGFAEMIACLIRVPVEVVKQRRQIMANLSSVNIVLQAVKHEGVKGMYRGFWSTVMRDLPFTVLQFPVLEYLKVAYKRKIKKDVELNSWEVGICGSIAGGTAAAVTTPLDVVKTRIILSNVESKSREEIKFSKMIRSIYRNEGVKGLFSGFVPRVLMITLGGLIFFGVYDFFKTSSHKYLVEKEKVKR